MSFLRLAGGALVASTLMISLPTDAAAIPAFARKYRVSCNLCHNPFPALTAFGEQFAGNGFRMAIDEEPRDTIATGDDLLTLPASVPLALRLDAYAQLYSDGKAATDFQLPFNLKLLSGGTLGKKLSYYIYFLLAERGEVAGIEDAFVYWNDIAGAPVDLAVGQFQVSDPMFKRELRLEVLDYAIYKVLVGLQPANLTYDRGLMASADLAGFTITGTLVNGDGIPAANELFRYDNDANKNLFGHITRDLGDHARLGLMGYTGRQNGEVYGFPGQDNAITMWGADATFGAGPVQLNLQYVGRTDTEADFVPGQPTVETDGGFAEVLFRPAGKRWYGYGLYNYIEASEPVLNVKMGVPVGVDEYESIAVGGGYLVYRNFRLYGEYGYDFRNELNRLTAGFTTAF
ncbi:MAG TPA: hypothetical protein PLI70_06675 [Gemmatimonadales bacterium]|nr:hypothetical protein [Gemmatimonadales bacterium]